MGLIEIILIGCSLAMDAFAVSVCKGLSIKDYSFNKCIIIALYFSFFQGLMPLIGYFLGEAFSHIVEDISSFLAAFLLFFIGFNMIKDSFAENANYDDNLSYKCMIPLAIATSIDALVVGVTFSFLEVNLLEAILIISLVTLIICMIGVTIGNKLGSKIGMRANLVSGIVLIVMAIKLFLEQIDFIFLINMI